MAVLFCLTYAVLFAFATTPGSVDADSGRSHIPQTSKPDGPAASPVKLRKKVSYIAPPAPAILPVVDREPEPARSIIVPGAFSYDVIQQPEDEPFFVSSASNLVTEFGLARKNSNIGLLAHNNLAGSSFKYLKPGQDIYIVRTNGLTEHYKVSDIHRFQALEPTKTESRFLDLQSGEILTATEVFTRMYTGAPHLTLQTCINANGDVSWGRLFVIAIPVTGME